MALDDGSVVDVEMRVNVCETVQRFLQCNGGKLEEAEDFKPVFIGVFLRVRIEIDQP